MVWLTAPALGATLGGGQSALDPWSGQVRGRHEKGAPPAAPCPAKPGSLRRRLLCAQGCWLSWPQTPLLPGPLLLSQALGRCLPRAAETSGELWERGGGEGAPVSALSWSVQQNQGIRRSRIYKTHLLKSFLFSSPKSYPASAKCAQGMNTYIGDPGPPSIGAETGRGRGGPRGECSQQRQDSGPGPGPLLNDFRGLHEGRGRRSGQERQVLQRPGVSPAAIPNEPFKPRPPYPRRQQAHLQQGEESLHLQNRQGEPGGLADQPRAQQNQSQPLCSPTGLRQPRLKDPGGVPFQGLWVPSQAGPSSGPEPTAHCCPSLRSPPSRSPGPRHPERWR